MSDPMDNLVVESVTVDETFDAEGNLIGRTTTTTYVKRFADGGFVKPPTPTWPNPYVGDVWPYGGVGSGQITTTDPNETYLVNLKEGDTVSRFVIDKVDARDNALRSLDGGGYTTDPYLAN